jgi:hypothetical protein
MQDNALTLVPAISAPALNIHLTGDRWEADCPGCGYTLAWATDQDTLDSMTGRITFCPVCHEGAA